MLFITRNLISRLVEPYKESDMLACYAISQAISSTTTRAVLLLNSTTLKVLFLNVFSTKVVRAVEFAIADLEHQQFKSGFFSSAIWSFQVNGQHWRFSIIKKMLTLGSMQGDFLRFLDEKMIP